MIALTTSRLLAAALLAYAAVMLACSNGGGGPDAGAGSPTLGRYVEGLTSLLEDANASVSDVYVGLTFDLGSNPSVDEQVSEAHDVSDSYQGLLADLAERLNELQPPQEVAGAHRMLLETIDPASRSWVRFSEHLDEVENQSELYEAYDAVRVYLRRFTDACDVIREIAAGRALAFQTSCSINIE